VLRNVFLKSVRDVRRAFVWWSVGLVGLVALIVAVWPSIRDNPALVEFRENYPEELQRFFSFGGEFDFGTPTGYLGTELFSFMVPLLLLVAGIGAGARSLAGEEERGTLDLLLAHPVRRVRLAVEKLAALTVELIGLAAVLLISLAVGATAAGMDVSLGHLAEATVSAFLLALAFAAVAFALGAATGRRGVAIGMSAATAVAAYLVYGLAPLVEAIGSVQWLSPWYFYAAADPLRHGLEPGHVLVLAAIAVIAAIAGLVAFDRRDVGVAG
jgi:ABC-2 type transport system permease protein